MTPNAALARNLRSYRRLKDLTQDAVASAMRARDHDTWSRTTVSDIEHGRRRVYVDELVNLALLFGVCLDELLQ